MILLPIDRGIPLPPLSNAHRGNQRRTRKYPWREMKVDESFFVSCPPQELAHRRRSLKRCIASLKGMPHHQFEIRRVEGGLRVWRTA